MSLRAPIMLPSIMGPTLTSRVLNLQLKGAMYAVMRDITRDILADLEQVFHQPRNKSTWAETLCVTMILCMCVEELQVAIDACVAFATEDPSLRLSGIKILRRMETHALEHIVLMFHAVYRTGRSSLNKKRDSGFNPIRNSLLIDAENGITQPMVDLVHEFRQIIKDHGKYLFRARRHKANPYREGHRGESKKRII